MGRLKAHKGELLAILRPEAGASSIDPTEPMDGSAPEALDPDGWPADCIDPGKLDPCPKCGTLELWQSLVGTWRCQRCDPPTTARNWLVGPAPR